MIGSKDSDVDVYFDEASGRFISDGKDVTGILHAKLLEHAADVRKRLRDLKDGGPGK